MATTAGYAGGGSARASKAAAGDFGGGCSAGRGHEEAEARGVVGSDDDTMWRVEPTHSS